MRVISGTARGLKLDSLEGSNTRPTLDRVKETLFNILQNQIADAYVLDLFAGSGALGIECASRGAKEVVFCDHSKQAIEVIKKNIQKARVVSQSKVVQADFKKCLDGSKKYHIVFLDPPYQTNLVMQALELISTHECLEEDGIIIIEAEQEALIQEIEKRELNIEIYDTRKYGRVKLIFARKG